MWGLVEISWENIPILQGFQAFWWDGEIRTNERLNNKTNGKKIDKLEHLHEKVSASFFIISNPFKPLKMPLNQLKRKHNLFQKV